MIEAIIILAIIISGLFLIGLIFALPLRLTPLRNQSKLFQWRLAFFLSLMAFVFTFAVAARVYAIGTMGGLCSSRVALSCPSSNPEQQSKTDLLEQELWLRNMLPLETCFTGDEEVCAVVAQYMPWRDYFFQLGAASFSFASCFFFAWRLTRDTRKIKEKNQE